MKIAIMQFPGTNCEHETLVAVQAAGMDGEIFRWNRPEQELSGFDGYVVPGGFSYQDRVRAGAIASKEPVMAALSEEAAAGKPILGICNGFQILVESGILPAGKGVSLALAQNVMERQGKIVRRGYYCAWTNLRHDSLPGRCAGSFLIEPGSVLQIPIAHAEGNLVAADPRIIDELRESGQVVFRYCDSRGQLSCDFPVNVNGSTDNIAGICNPEGNVLGLMPHPERAFFSWQLPYDHPIKRDLSAAGPGRLIFESIRRYIEVRR
ncbi:MAG: phosphoribosylformylglycinamidine synthase I [Methanosaeta sp. PtaB.Bin039]|nr:MAG: phosphoribosylformylglycinamidine synthase I [Methanosaeta sp. PtaB.Bin039]OPY45229.1 MAG: phosphoribosylformylglycinamidine synthase I [Methanosaeta sp. PtaU1.Bin028]HQF16604.1 phosphoribosylformylglycinamidine synthase I [Methanotrichaceae archaeon]HQI91236.1 phosphoribosylformylglycinamidine synthase I [Methanotrichaceae archaeon]HQJ61716.1 phosphoribosylformylglycinamidine synthase I [Methanothrix soehngenii]